MSVSRIAEKIGGALGTLRALGPLIDIIYPRVCLICARREANSAPLICSRCWKNLQLQIQEKQADAVQRKPAGLMERNFMAGGKDGKGGKFRSQSLPIISLAGFVDPLAEMIRLFKFQGYSRLGQRLGRLLAKKKSSRIRKLSPHCLIATPLHISDFKRRGFNQAEILSDILSGACGLKPAGNLIAKPVRTKHQSRLGAEERIYNLAGAFEAAPELEGARVALVDDVITTGSTIREIGRTLSEAGAVVVGAVALASEIRTFRLDEDEEINDSKCTDDEDFPPF